MNWPVTIGVLIGVVAGINLGVLLMAAFQAGRRSESDYETAALQARILELEAALAERAGAGAPEVSVVSQTHPETKTGQPVGVDSARLRRSSRAS